MASALDLGIRGGQIIFGVIALGLSAGLLAGYGSGKPPGIFDYATFASAVTLLFALVGIAANFVSAIDSAILLVLDGVASLFLLAGGIAFAVIIKVGSCNNDQYLSDHIKTFAPGKDKFKNEEPNTIIDQTKKQCRMSQADTAFLWFLFFITLVATAMSFKGRSGGSRNIV